MDRSHYKHKDKDGNPVPLSPVDLLPCLGQLQNKASLAESEETGLKERYAEAKKHTERLQGQVRRFLRAYTDNVRIYETTGGNLTTEPPDTQLTFEDEAGTSAAGAATNVKSNGAKAEAQTQTDATTEQPPRGRYQTEAEAKGNIATRKEPKDWTVEVDDAGWFFVKRKPKAKAKKAKAKKAKAKKKTSKKK